MEKKLSFEATNWHYPSRGSMSRYTNGDNIEQATQFVIEAIKKFKE